MMKCYKIRPLEWTKFGPLTWELKTIFGKYSVFTRDGKWFVWFATHDNYKGCLSLSHGQQLAEADWRARILPALEEVSEVAGTPISGNDPVLQGDLIWDKTEWIPVICDFGEPALWFGCPVIRPLKSVAKGGRES